MIGFALQVLYKTTTIFKHLLKVAFILLKHSLISNERANPYKTNQGHLPSLDIPSRPRLSVYLVHVGAPIKTRH